MIIEISINNDVISLLLKEKKKVIDSLVFPEERQLSEKLLPAIDKLIKKNRLNSKDIRKITMKSDLGDNFTTCRIAKTVAKTWNWTMKSR